MRVNEFIDKLPPDTQDRVDKAAKRFNQVTREAVRNVTRLSLQKGKRKSLHGDEQLESRVPVHTKIAAPEAILHLEIPESGRIAAVLSEFKPDLEMLKNTSSYLMNIMMNGTGFDIVDKDVFLRPDIDQRVGDLEGAGEFARLLLAEIEAFDVMSWLFVQVRDDVLGRYYYSSQSLSSEDISNSRIELYYGVIGIAALRMGVEIEDLTAVVLAHELAHAYTHLGFDTNNNRWSDEGFHESQHELKEGLAQYYGKLALEHLTTIIPNAVDAYEKLLIKQPPAYHVQQKWFEQASPESVRHTLVMLRRENAVGLDMFNRFLHSTGKETSFAF